MARIVGVLVDGGDVSDRLIVTSGVVPGPDGFERGPDSARIGSPDRCRGAAVDRGSRETRRGPPAHNLLLRSVSLRDRSGEALTTVAHRVGDIAAVGDGDYQPGEYVRNTQHIVRPRAIPAENGLCPASGRGRGHIIGVTTSYPRKLENLLVGLAPQTPPLSEDLTWVGGVVGRDVRHQVSIADRRDASGPTSDPQHRDPRAPRGRIGGSGGPARPQYIHHQVTCEVPLWVSA